MKRKRMLPIATVAGLLLLLAAAWVVAPRLHEFAYRRTPLGEEAHRALATPPWNAVRIPSGTAAEEARLRGLVREPATAGGPWILMLPGNARQLITGFRGAMDALCEAMDPAPGVAFWAWRGFDGSTGEPSPEACLEDARAAWRYLTEERGVPPTKIHLMGYSLGTAPAVHLARELSGRETPPASLILLSPYTAIGVMGTGLFDRFAASHRFDALGAAVPLPCPVLVLHGRDDDVLPVEGARELANAFGPDTELHILERAGHADWLGDPARWEPVRDWIRGRDER